MDREFRERLIFRPVFENEKEHPMRSRFEPPFSWMWRNVCGGPPFLVWIWVLLLAGCQPLLVIPAPETSGLSARITAEFSRATAAVRAHPRSATDWGHFGQLCMAHQFSAEALSCFRTAANLAPQDPRWPYLQGVLLEESDLEESWKCYANAVAAGGNAAIVRYRQGQVLWRLGRPADAMRELQQAAELAPEHPAPLLAISRLAMNQSDWTTAEESLQRALKGAPSSPSVQQELSRLAARQGKWREANEYQQTVKLGFGNEVSLDDQWLKEVTDLELAGQPDAAIADRLLAEGRLTEAAAVLQGVVRDHSELHRARLNLAVALWQLGKIDESQRNFHQLIKEFPDEPSGCLAWGRLLASVGRFQEAKTRFQMAIDRKADAAEASFLLGSIAERLGDDQTAIHWYRQASHAAPEVAANTISLARLYEKSGDFEAAAHYWKAAVRLKPSDGEVIEAMKRISLRIPKTTLGGEQDTPVSALRPENLLQ